MKALRSANTAAIKAEDVAFLAVGEKYRGELIKRLNYPKRKLKWMRSLAKLISGDLFGADRIDYLERDAYHAGVPYGRLDIEQLSRSVVSAKKPQQGPDYLLNFESFASDMEHTDLAVVTSFLTSRQLMYSNVYQQPTAKIYDVHLQDFVRANLTKGEKLGKVENLVHASDTDLLFMLKKAYKDKTSPNHIHARRILGRKHFRLVAQLSMPEMEKLYLHWAAEFPDYQALEGVRSQAQAIHKMLNEMVSEEEDQIKYFLFAPKPNTDHDITKASAEKNQAAGYAEELHELRAAILDESKLDKARYAKVLQELEDIILAENEPDKRGYAKIFEELRAGDFNYFSIYADPDLQSNARRQLRKIIKDAGINIK